MKSRRFQFIAIAILATAITLWVGVGLQWLLRSPPPLPAASTTTPAPILSPSLEQPTTGLPAMPLGAVPSAPVPSGAVTPNSTPAGEKAPLSRGSASPTLQPVPIPTGDEIARSYGHFRYQEDQPSNLVVMGTYGDGELRRTESLDYEAAAAYREMVAAAQVDGIELILISGFRTVEQQEQLFQRQIQRQGSEIAAAQLSAPPGFSEHHTGLAIDVGDRNQQDTDLKFAFEQTQAYAWLKNNAQRYGFEQSFPENNSQGVSFEPWHWRYADSPRARRVFAAALALGNG
jgi:zinc D-Ala-D-Ala carboxypeptidase